MPIVHVDAGAGADPPTAHELVRRRAAVCFAVVCTLCPSLAHSKPYARLGFIIFTNNDQSDLCTQPRVSGVSVWLQASLASSQLTRCAWPLVQLGLGRCDVDCCLL
mgnify:CR=1 FL=1